MSKNRKNLIDIYWKLYNLLYFLLLWMSLKPIESALYFLGISSLFREVG